MKFNLYKVFLIGGLYFLNSIDITQAKETILMDKVAFKVATEVFTINDLKNYSESMNTMKCIYPSSLLIQVFKKEFFSYPKHVLDIKKSYTGQQKAYLNSVIKFGKLLVYSRSYEVNMKSSLETYFYHSAKKNNCKLMIFDREKKFTPIFKELMELEIFVRSRFLPSESQGKSTSEDIKKAIISAKDLVKSINKQIEQEVYW